MKTKVGNLRVTGKTYKLSGYRVLRLCFIVIKSRLQKTRGLSRDSFVITHGNYYCQTTHFLPQINRFCGLDTNMYLLGFENRM